MSQTDLELRLTRWLDDGPHGAPGDVVEAALAEARLEPQDRVFTLPWARLPRLAQTDYGPLVQAAAGVPAAILAIVVIIWAFNYATLPPSASPSPSASPTVSPSGPPAATPVPMVIPTPVARFVGLSTTTTDGTTFAVYELALDNRVDFAGEFFDESPEYTCTGDVPGRRTLVDIRDGDSGEYLARYCGGYDLDALTFQRPFGGSFPATAYIELVDRLTSLTVRSASISLPPPPASFTPGPPTGPPAPPGWSSPVIGNDGQYDDVALAFDDQLHGHIAAAVRTGARDYGILYATNSSGRWVPEGLTPQVAGSDSQDHDTDVAIAVDPDGTVWIAFTRFGPGDIIAPPALQTFVMRNVDGAWGPPVVVAGAGSRSASIAAQGGVLHMAYVVDQAVYYANNSSGTFEAQLISDDGTSPQLRLGLDGRPRIAYGTPDGVRLATIATSGPEYDLPPGVATGAADDVLMYIRGEDVYLVWRDVDSSAYFRTTRTAIGWTATTEVPVGDFIPDALVVDGADETAMQFAGRSDQAGGALSVFGIGGPSGTALVDADVVASDLVLAGGALHIAYVYTGSELTAGVWFMSHNTE